MKGALLVDTDILVDFLLGYGRAVDFVTDNAERIHLSAIVVAELFAGVKGEKEQAALEAFVSLFPVIPVDAEIAKAGGLYRRDYGKSHGVGLADAILAATAEVSRSELKTLNIRHYPMIKSLRSAYAK